MQGSMDRSTCNNAGTRRSSRGQAVLFLVLGVCGACHLLVDSRSVFHLVGIPVEVNVYAIGHQTKETPNNATISLPPQHQPGQQHQTRNLLAYWVEFNPASEPPTDYVYYHEVAQAFNRHDQVVVCEKELLKECWDQAQNTSSILVPIINHWLISKEKFSRSQALADELTLLFQHATTAPTCVTVLFLLNKVYKNVGDKVHGLVSPFANLVKVVNNTRVMTTKSTSSINLLATTCSPHAEEWSTQFGLPIVFCPFATDVTSFDLTDQAASNPWSNRSCDIFLRWDTSPRKYRMREEIHAELAGDGEANNHHHEDIKVMAPTTFLNETSYKQALVECKMTGTTIGMHGWIDLLGTRYYEVMASGTTLLLAERPSSSFSIDSYRQLGMVENDTIVTFSSLEELLQKIRYYQRHPEEAAAIIRRAHERAMLQHGWDNRARLMVDAIREHSKC
jgi:hypothetical protein